MAKLERLPDFLMTLVIGNLYGKQIGQNYFEATQTIKENKMHMHFFKQAKF